MTTETQATTSTPDVRAEGGAASSTQPFATFPDAESFQKRVDREAKKALRELGIEDPQALKSILAEHESFKKAAEEAKRAQMSEVERLKADLDAKERLAQEAMSAAEEARFDAHIYRMCVKKGIRNHEYAKWMIANELSRLPEDGQLDEEAYFETALSDATTRAALGVEPPPAPAVPVAKPPLNTSPYQGAAPVPGGVIPAKTVMDLSKDEWQNRKKALGVIV